MSLNQCGSVLCRSHYGVCDCGEDGGVSTRVDLEGYELSFLAELADRLNRLLGSMRCSTRVRIGDGNRLQLCVHYAADDCFLLRSILLLASSDALFGSWYAYLAQRVFNETETEGVWKES